MFFRPKKNTYVVKSQGRAGLVYSEGEKSMHVDSELLLGGRKLGVAIYTRSIRAWDPPYENKLITEDDKSRIANNIKEDYERHGYSVELDDS